MKTRTLSDNLISQLIHRFVEIGMAQDKALFDDRIAEYNRLYREKTSIVSELKSRAGDQRQALLQLYDHPNLQVRLNAAMATLAVAPQSARKVLEAIRASRMPHQALDAGMTISNLDSGFFKPE